jgi:hypothetical protein
VHEPFKMLVLGQALHWIEGKLDPDQLFKLIEAGCGVAIVATTPTIQKETSTEVYKSIKA